MSLSQDLSDEEIDHILERYDRTDAAFQRRFPKTAKK